MMNFAFLEPYITYLALAFLGLLGLYIRNYLKARAKMAVLKSENRKLVEQTESIKAKFNREIEELRKEHQLDLEKRKFQYDSKQKQYIAFFKFLDNFGGDYNINTQKRMIPIIQEFTTNFYLAAQDNNSSELYNASAIYSTRIQKLILDANTELTRIKQETNTIRLIASDSVIRNLDLLDIAYDTAFAESSKMLGNLPDQLAVNDQVAMQKDQDNIEIVGKQLLKTKDELIQQMRFELNII